MNLDKLQDDREGELVCYGPWGHKVRQQFPRFIMSPSTSSHSELAPSSNSCWWTLQLSDHSTPISVFFYFALQPALYFLFLFPWSRKMETKASFVISGTWLWDSEFSCLLPFTSVKILVFKRDLTSFHFTSECMWGLPSKLLTSRLYLFHSILIMGVCTLFRTGGYSLKTTHMIVVLDLFWLQILVYLSY